MATTRQTNHSPILGYFVFKDFGDGCLGSKYSNTINHRLFGETAVRQRDSIPEPADVYIGTYQSSWLDESGVPDSGNQAILKIGRKDSTVGQYSLTWMNPRNEHDIYYHGEGMLIDGSLVGSYWDRPIQDLLQNR